jgi:hypothetical protein
MHNATIAGAMAILLAGGVDLLLVIILYLPTLRLIFWRDAT